MTIKPRIADISEVGLIDRTADSGVFAEHQEAVEKLLFALEAKGRGRGIDVATVETFETGNVKIPQFVNETFVDVRAAAQAGDVYDFGVVKDAMVKEWAGKAEQQPIKALPWSSKPAIFLATHPEEIPFEKAISVYLLKMLDAEHIQLTEMMFVSGTAKLFIYGGIIAMLPLGSTMQVFPNAWSSPPSVDTVGSVLNPCLMGTAFLVSESGKGRA